MTVLSRYIASITGLEIAGQCSNAIEALDVLQHKTIDVIFLDIKMPRIIGTEFLKSLPHPPKVIFVTAYREYAVYGAMGTGGSSSFRAANERRRFF